MFSLNSISRIKLFNSKSFYECFLCEIRGKELERHSICWIKWCRHVMQFPQRIHSALVPSLKGTDNFQRDETIADIVHLCLSILSINLNSYVLSTISLR